MSQFKIGRNDPCFCGSGKKYKKCCLEEEKSRDRFSTNIPPEIIHKFEMDQIKEKIRVEKFGKVKPNIGIEFKGKKIVAVGSRLYSSKKWKYFADFLFEYLPIVIGKEWFQIENDKPIEEQHPLVYWKNMAIDFMKERNGITGITPNGFLAAYITFAYDIYIIDSNSRLDENILSRLKKTSQFQGAKHEIFAEATCLRAGYTIEHENEKDRSKKHAEFVATHKVSGLKVSVEAKSKHRAGVLGFKGKLQAEKELSFRFGGLINDAIKKDPPYPLVIFLDTNLPSSVAESIFKPESQEPFIPPRIFFKLLESIKNTGRDPFNLIIFTNHPHHYVKANEADPKKHRLSIIPEKPMRSLKDLKPIIDIYEATQKYGNIPKELPKEG
jgi:hypothetical protein